jgi:DMSO/TMAO reductase YedYZ molybdopterin-dependent catalytic subunit
VTAQERLPPGQVWGKKFVVYAALGIPRVDPKNWKLKIDGLVKQPLEYTYYQLTSGELFHYTRSFHCLLPGNMVYANPEPKRIEDVAVGDMVIGRDGLGHGVRKLIRKHHKGKIIGVKASSLPAVLMTPEHPVLAVRGNPGEGKSRSRRRKKTFAIDPVPHWVPAGDLEVGDYTFFPKYKYVSHAQFISYAGVRFPIDERLASLLGWYVAEGSGADSDGRGISFALSSREEKEASRLRTILEELFGAKTSIYKNQRGTLLKVAVTSSSFKRLAPIFKAWCGNDAFSKRIPDFILNASPDILRTFLLAYLKGDGYSPFESPERVRGSDFIDMTTSSLVLAYQLILALSKLGIPAGVVNHPGSVRNSYSVRARGPRLSRLIPKFPVDNRVDRFRLWETSRGFYYPVRKVWTEDYDGEVYDFQAPGFTMLSPFVTQDCVTSWSIKDVEWDGVQIRKLVEPAGVDPSSKWVMFHCVDGYTAPIPIEDALRDDSIVALRLNGNPLSAEQGFPARPFMPHLYAWKSAKWLNRIEFIRDYSDGYWEMYGYHERADVWEEERFKGHSGRHSRKTAYGTA